jgi:hypothetical protein
MVNEGLVLSPEEEEKRRNVILKLKQVFFDSEICSFLLCVCICICKYKGSLALRAICITSLFLVFGSFIALDL